jgi:hypothetical protein
MECIATGLNVVKALGWDREAKLGFCFRWTGLGGRELASWANPLVNFAPGRVAEQDRVDCYVAVPVDTPVSAIGPYVETAINQLYILFRGMEMPREAVEHWVQRFVERRL